MRYLFPTVIHRQLREIVFEYSKKVTWARSASPENIFPSGKFCYRRHTVKQEWYHLNITSDCMSCRRRNSTASRKCQCKENFGRFVSWLRLFWGSNFSQERKENHTKLLKFHFQQCKCYSSRNDPNWGHLYMQLTGPTLIILR